MMTISLDESWSQLCLDISQKALGIAGAVKELRSVNAVMTQGRQKRHGFPVAERRRALEPRAARRSPHRRHIGLGPGFVDENEAAGSIRS
jgi:hypothetical protein